MEYLVAFLLKYGYAGMLGAAFLAGSFFPFSSEAVMTGLQIAGLSAWRLMIVASIGNTLGGLFNYSVGRLGREDWLYRLFRVKEERLAKSEHFVRKYGAWMGLLSWLPILGSVITIALGLLRVSWWRSLITIFIGKAARYAVLALLLEEIN